MTQHWPEGERVRLAGMVPAEQQSLAELVEASEREDASAVARVWRRLTPAEQEDVVFGLLAMHTAASSGAVGLHDGGDLPIDDQADTVAMAPAANTELIPKVVADLRDLTASEGDDEPPERPTAAVGPTEYWSRWLRRWKLSALVSAWAMTTTFAFTTETAAFGPTEWLVALLGTIVLGGGLVGTLANFAVAALPIGAERKTADS